MSSKSDFLNQSISTEILTTPLSELDNGLPFMKKFKVEMKGLIANEINIHYDYFTDNSEKQEINNEIQLENKDNSEKQEINNEIQLENKENNEIELNNKEIRIMELEKENKELKKQNDELNNKIIELFKMMNELLKIKPKNDDFNSNYEDIKNKITTMFYREIRLKHVLPFSRFVSTFGLNALHTMKQEKDNIKKSNSLNDFNG